MNTLLAIVSVNTENNLKIYNFSLTKVYNYVETIRYADEIANLLCGAVSNFF